MERLDAPVSSFEEWYILKNFSPDVHVLMTEETNQQPAAWARMEGAGRVYATTLGHSEQTWKNPAFRQMLLGAIRWTTRMSDANIAPGKAQ